VATPIQLDGGYLLVLAVIVFGDRRQPVFHMNILQFVEVGKSSLEGQTDLGDSRLANIIGALA